MSFTFTSAANYPYRPSSIFLGIDPETGREVGLETERHIFCAAGSRAGKGVGLICQNLKRWPHATIVIDPKGENSEITWKDRLAKGQTVAVLDPFKEADIPDKVRAYFNPLDGITVNRPGGRELIQDIADGVITKYNDDHMEWVVGARDIVSGVIAYVIETLPPEYINLPSVRALINSDKDILESNARKMLQCNAFGGLAKAGGNIILKALHSDKGLPPQLLDMAQRGSSWIDSDEISECLCRTTFDIGGLKKDDLSLYLVLPPKEIVKYKAFFRLMVKTALNVMMTGGRKSKGRCLFILDEFASLDKLEELEEAAGRMPSYGVHLWPFVQQIGQLQKLYGKEGAETFLGNADAQIYFNPQDSLTLEYMSKWAGRFKPRELHSGPPQAPVMIATKDADSSDAQYNALQQSIYQTRMSQYQDAMRLSGTPRITTSEIMALTGKGNDEKIARSMIVFAKAGDVLNLWIAPFFMTTEEVIKSKSPTPPAPPPKTRLSDFTPLEVIAGIIRETFKRSLNPPSFEVFLGGVRALCISVSIALIAIYGLSLLTLYDMYGWEALTRRSFHFFIKLCENWCVFIFLCFGVPGYFLHHLRERISTYKAIIKQERAAINTPVFTEQKEEKASTPPATEIKPKGKGNYLCHNLMKEQLQEMRYAEIREKRGEALNNSASQQEIEAYLTAHDQLPEDEQIKTRNRAWVKNSDGYVKLREWPHGNFRRKIPGEIIIVGL